MNDVTHRPGTRVRLRPSRRADIMDLALAGRIAEVAAVEEDFEGQVHIAVVLEGDPSPMRVRFPFQEDDEICDMARTYGQLRVIDGDTIDPQEGAA